MQRPPGWPAAVEFTKTCQWHISVGPTVRQQLVDASKRQQTPQPAKVVIHAISDSTHPAHGQYGLFAAQKIPAKTYIIDYIGEMHCDDRPTSDYDLSLCRLSDGTSVGIDARKKGNQARFVNDYRGIADRPNVSFLERRNEQGELRMSLYSGTQEIKKGSELLVSYGKSWWQHHTGSANAAPE